MQTDQTDSTNVKMEVHGLPRSGSGKFGENRQIVEAKKLSNTKYI